MQIVCIICEIRHLMPGHGLNTKITLKSCWIKILNYNQFYNVYIAYRWYDGLMGINPRWYKQSLTLQNLHILRIQKWYTMCNTHIHVCMCYTWSWVLEMIFISYFFHLIFLILNWWVSLTSISGQTCLYTHNRLLSITHLYIYTSFKWVVTH